MTKKLVLVGEEPPEDWHAGPPGLAQLSLPLHDMLYNLERGRARLLEDFDPQVVDLVEGLLRRAIHAERKRHRPLFAKTMGPGR